MTRRRAVAVGAALAAMAVGGAAAALSPNDGDEAVAGSPTATEAGHQVRPTTSRPSTTTSTTPTTTTTAPPRTITTAAATTRAPPPPSAAPAGGRAPTSAPAGWSQVFRDDFDGTSVDWSRWSDYDPGTPISNSDGRGVYNSDRVVTVVDGVLRFDIHMDRGTGYAATLQPRLPTQVYGRYEVRFRSGPGAGSKFVWMTWPDSNDWNEGEIDFAEDDPTDGTQRRLGAYNHFRGSPREQDAFEVDVDLSQWHTATMEWRPGEVRFHLDGNLIGTSTTGVPVDPMHLLLQTEVCSYAPCPAEGERRTIEVDWVTVATLG